MPRIMRQEILNKLYKQVGLGIPIIGSGAGLGICAKSAEAGGADMIIIYNSGMFRMAGRGSSCGRLAYSDANSVVMDMANEVLPVVKHTPVIAGVIAHDPFIDLDAFLKTVAERGFSGVQNFPSVGNRDASTMASLAYAGYGYDKEVEMVKKARALELLTTPYCWTAEQATAMAEAGADIIVAHMGLTTKGLIGAAEAKTLDECVERCKEIAKAAKAVRSDILIITHGGPVSEPQDAQYIFDNVEDISGFYGASSAERIPTEKAIIGTVKELKTLKIA